MHSFLKAALAKTLPSPTYDGLRYVYLRRQLPSVLFSWPCDPVIANYHIHVSSRHRFVYFEVPKAGCSTIKAALHRAELQDRDAHPPDDVHNRSHSPLLSPASVGDDFEICLRSPQWRRVTFVRDPWSRALSCYLHKFFDDPGERRRLAPQLGLDPARPITFRDFLEAVAAQPIARMDGHWAPQTALLAPDLVDYDFIGRFERLESDLRRLLRSLGAAAPIERRGRVSHAAARLGDFYDGAAAALVRSIYARDFAVLDYPTGVLNCASSSAP